MDIAKVGQISAQQYLAKHRQRGMVRPPARCEDCSKRTRKLVAHHADYNKPLDVGWLCRACHGVRHSRSLPSYVEPIHVAELSELRRPSITKKSLGIDPKIKSYACPPKLKQMMCDKGTNLRQWCIDNGFNRNNVSSMFAGRLPANSGKVGKARAALDSQFPYWDFERLPVLLEKVICLGCNHIWQPKKIRPVSCPRCNNLNWDGTMPNIHKDRYKAKPKVKSPASWLMEWRAKRAKKAITEK